jgi:hypothetical protein
MPIPPFVLVRPPAQDFIRIWTQIALDPNLLTDQRSAVSFTYFMFYFPQARKTERKGKKGSGHTSCSSSHRQEHGRKKMKD